MNNRILSGIIFSIRKNDSIETIFQKNYTYGQIGRTLVQALEEGYLLYENDKYIVTDKGNTYIKSRKIFGPNKINEKYYRRDTLSIDEIYVPSYNI